MQELLWVSSECHKYESSHYVTEAVTFGILKQGIQCCTE